MRPWLERRTRDYMKASLPPLVQHNCRRRRGQLQPLLLQMLTAQLLWQVSRGLRQQRRLRRTHALAVLFAAIERTAGGD